MTGTPTPTERILNLAAYLKLCGTAGATLDAIATNVHGYDHDAARDEHGTLLSEGPEWEALRRMLRRDLEDLRRSWGVDAVYDEDDHCYRLQPPFFTTRERTALIAAAATVDVEGIDVRDGQLGAGVDDAVAQVVIRVHDLVIDLREAISTRTAVRFDHEGRSRVLEPYALGVWRGRWYVAGWDPEIGALRRYRLDRVEHHGALDRVGAPGTFTVPDWFDAVLAFDFDPNAWGRDPRLRARVRVERDHLPAFLADFGGEVVDEVDGEPVVAFEVRHHESTRNRLLFFRDHVRVLAPAELVTIMREHLAALAGGA